jgi:pSer/pThr/pTyr-binding forkhead associated (FHA) protein
VSELTLTLLRFAFLGLLWVFVIFAFITLRRDLRQPADARPTGQRTVRPPRTPKPAKAPRSARVKGSKIVVVEGPLTGTEIPLVTEPITVGRAPDSTIVIDDDYASSRHARIYPADGAWIVEDLGSTNGTWLDRTRITTPTVLPLGVPLRVGRSTLQMQK